MSESLATLMARRLREAGIALAAADAESLRIPARAPAVGDIFVSFEGGQVSVFLGDITHRHFTPYEADDKFPGCTDEQAATDAAHFIREVVEDKWVIWCWRDGRGGCFKPGGDDEESADSPLPGEEVMYFRWSGPFVPSNTSLERTRDG
jgi:hypothetical protein